MIKDYKGEMPKNVTTPDKAKGQKPFYKNWKFWVLTGLMTLFGACSIYGLVLGSQYVQAIERASHIIADAQSAPSESRVLKKNINMLGSVGEVGVLDMGEATWTKTTNYRFASNAIANKAIYPQETSERGELLAEQLTTKSQNEVYLNQEQNSIALGNNGILYVFISVDYYNQTTPEGFKTEWAGNYVYYKMSFSGQTADEFFTSEGYENGYDEGYADGYTDGSDAINVNQYFRVVMPVGNDSVQYESYVDGVASEEGQINGGTTSPNYREFTRNRNQVLRVDLTLPSGYRAFWSYTPAFTSSFPVDDNISLQQSWAVGGVVYLPTWVSSVQIWVGVTSAQVPDLTYQSISVAFDVAHWGDIKVGAYQEGYQQGYVDGQQDPTAYQSGYDAGYSDGHDAGEVEGFNRGVGVGSSGSSSLAHMFRVAFQLPFDQLYAYLNFNLLGINFASLFSALITVSLGIIVIKKVL